MERGVFLQTLGFAAVGAASPLPSAQPSPSPTASATPFPWDMCTKSPALPYDRPLEIKMRVLDGPDFDLMHYRGKALLLNIFTTWCGPCNLEMPYIVDAATAYADRGLVIIGIDTRETDDAVRAFRKKYGIPFPIAMDEHGGFAYRLEVGESQANVVYPTSLFIDPHGYLYCVQRGNMRKDELTYRLDHFVSASFAAPTPSPGPTDTPGSQH